MTISQSGIKSNIFYCHTGLVLINAIATQHCIHDPTFRHSSPSVFIRGDLMLKTQDLRPYILDNMTSFAIHHLPRIFASCWQMTSCCRVYKVLGLEFSTSDHP